MALSINHRSISSKVLAEEAKKLGLVVDIIDANNNFFSISSSEKKILFKSTDFGGNSALGYKIADDKSLTYNFLDTHNIPVPKTITITEENYNSKTLGRSIQGLSFPLVAKPIDGSHGDGVIMHIHDIQELQTSIETLMHSYKDIIVQEEIHGDEVRVLIVKGQFLLAIHRIPAHIIGDNINTIQDLIYKENKNIMRGDGYNKPLSNIDVNEYLLRFIKKQGLSLGHIAKDNEHVQLRGTSNLGTGGTIQDVSDIIAQETKDMCIHIADICGLEICGIDIISPDISLPLEENNGVVLEINATPGFGGDRELSNVNTAKKTLELLFFP